MKRTPLKRGTKGLTRTPMKRKPSTLKRTAMKRKPKESLTPQQTARRAAWINWVVPTGLKECPVCGKPKSASNPIQGHHVVEQQVLERRAKDLGFDPELVVWDVDAGMPVGKCCHEPHTNASKRLPRSAIPTRCLAFLAALNLTQRIDRTYRDE